MTAYYLGVDIGSLYTKFVVIDSNNAIKFKEVIKTINRNKSEQDKVIKQIKSKFNILHSCGTGYGRHHHYKTDITKTEIFCASSGVSQIHPEVKTIIDVGGEDIKVISSDPDGKVKDFYMNTKCAAGTGSFITEVAERAEIDLSKMSELASKSKFSKELNSFCTVFAKTEIMTWIFDDIPTGDIARGIYISVANRIEKIMMDKPDNVYLIGGVIDHHPCLKDVMRDIFKQKVSIVKNPKYIVALGAALFAKELSK